MVFRACKKLELKHTWYENLDVMADTLLSPSAVLESDGMAMKCAGTKVKKSYQFVMSTFPGKEL